MRVLDRMRALAKSMPESAVVLSSGEGQSVSYASLVGEIEKRMQWLQLLETRVLALHAGNSMEWILIDLACQALNIVSIPLPEFFCAEQLARCLSASGVDTILSDKSKLPNGVDAGFLAVRPYPNESVNPPYFAWVNQKANAPEIPIGTQKITFTSGSTGNPKGVCLSLDHQWQVAASLASVIALDNPTHLCVLPLSTLLENIAGVYAPLLCGGSIVAPSEQYRGLIGSSNLDARASLRCISEQKPTSLILVPQLLRLLVNACASGWQPPSSLKFIAVGGGRVATSLIQSARDYGLPVYQGYGLSECGSVVSLNTSEHDQVNSAGKLLPHCKAKIVDGELVVSGASYLGYLGKKESWYGDEVRTGDIGKLEDDFLTISGRKKNLLVSSFGRNIHPEWVESVLLTHPAFGWCVVVGEAKPYLSAIISAAATVSHSDIQNWVDQCNQALPDYAQVKRWLRADGSHMAKHLTANGRVKREQVLADYEAKLNSVYANS